MFQQMPVVYFPLFFPVLQVQHFFDDPEGKIELPPSLKDRVDHWKRPQDFITEKVFIFLFNLLTVVLDL